MASTIPTVDLSSFSVDEGVMAGDEPTPSQAEAAAQINDACRRHGFVHVLNFGLSPATEASAFAAAAALFAQPEQHKLDMLARITPKTNTGYSPFAFECLNRARPPDLKEAFNVRDPDVHNNDFAGCPDGFEVAALALWAELAQAARRYAVACALALGLERDYFARSLSRLDLCTLRFLHYPPCDMPSEAAVDGTSAPIRVGEHTDFGAYTFLLLGEGAQGLQIKPVVGGEVGGSAGGEVGGWIDAVLPARPPGTVAAVVNTGALMARWTNDHWRATAHRVIVPTAEVAAAHRYSIACFIDPDAEAPVAVDERFVRPGEAPRYGPTTGLEFLLMKLREAQGA